MTRTGQTSRWSSIRRNLISVVPRRWPQLFLKCRAPCAADRSRGEAGRSRPPGPGRNAGPAPAVGAQRRPRIPPSAPTAPVAQHRWRDAQLACDLRQWPTAARQQRYRFPLELIGKLTPSLAHSTPSRSDGAYQRCPPIRGSLRADGVAHLGRWTGRLKVYRQNGGVSSSMTPRGSSTTASPNRPPPSVGTNTTCSLSPRSADRSPRPSRPPLAPEGRSCNCPQRQHRDDRNPLRRPPNLAPQTPPARPGLCLATFLNILKTEQMLCRITNLIAQRITVDLEWRRDPLAYSSRSAERSCLWQRDAEKQDGDHPRQISELAGILPRSHERRLRGYNPSELAATEFEPDRFLLPRLPVGIEGRRNLVAHLSRSAGDLAFGDAGPEDKRRSSSFGIRSGWTIYIAYVNGAYPMTIPEGGPLTAFRLLPRVSDRGPGRRAATGVEVQQIY